MPIEKQFLDLLGDNAIGRTLTARKTSEIVNRNGEYYVSGFVVTDSKGNVGIIDKAAVRWLHNFDFQGIMHPKQTE